MVKNIRYYLLALALVGFSSKVGQLENLSVAKDRVETYYESGQYAADVAKVVNHALHHFAKVPVTPDATVIFDVDDTALSTFAFEKAISYGHIPELSHNYEQHGQLPAISDVRRLYDYLVQRGFHIIFLSGRINKAREGTIKNLEEEGYTKFDTLITRCPAEEKLTAQAYKSAHRAALEDEGYHIVGSIGDQWSDLHGGHAGYEVKIPNYLYIIK